MKNKALENGWNGGRNKEGRKYRFRDKKSVSQDDIKNEKIKIFERDFENDGVYFDFETGQILNIFNFVTYFNNCFYAKKYLKACFTLIRSYPLYENQKEHKLTYLDKEFAFYIYSEEEYEIKKSIDDKKMLLESFGDKLTGKTTSKRRM